MTNATEATDGSGRGRLPPVHIAALATASPEHRLPQSELAAFARRFFGDMPDLPRLLASFHRADIEERQLARPVAWYEQRHTFAEKNAVYRQTALALGHRSAEAALDQAGVEPDRVGAILFVSSTGIATPSLEATMAPSLGLNPGVMRMPVWGLGCAGGAAGLTRAATVCAALQAPVLLVCVEVCSVTFVQDDHRKANVIATALFGDGAAAAVLVPGLGHGPRVLGGHSHLLAQTEHVMGWDLGDDGLAVRFSPEIPAITERIAPIVVQEVTARFGATPGHCALHPGGRKVIEAYERALALGEGALLAERAVLRAHGNMSGPTVLFVLQRAMNAPPPPGTHTLVLGLGPGFCAEASVLRW